MAYPDDRRVTEYFRRSAVALQIASADDKFCGTVGVIAGTVERAVRTGGKILLAGNGGSAADAQHIAGEFVARFALDRAPLPAIALTADTSVLTAIGNDFGFEHVFERQVLGLGRAGDVFIAISTSGRSSNILTALRSARSIGMTTVGFTGASTSSMKELCDICLCVPSNETPLIQQVYMIAAHAICGIVEASIFGARRVEDSQATVLDNREPSDG